MVLRLRPTWLIGSPPCTSFSKLNTNMNFPKMDPAVVAEKVAQGRRHLRFVLSLYKLQLDGGRHFLHEHPAGAQSWQDDWMLRLLKHPRVRTVVCDQCMYGLVTHSSQTGQPVAAMKPTR